MTKNEREKFIAENSNALAEPTVNLVRQVIEKGVRAILEECIALQEENNRLRAAQTHPVTSPDIETMVNRFLGWKLPADFYPDCGISFDGRKDDEWNKNKTWPVGTNLFTADQAKAMLLHCLNVDAQQEQQP